MQVLASVVLPTHGRRASLLRVLQALGQQTVPPDTFEVVVVCDGDVDGSAIACHTLAATVPYPLRVVTQENQGPAAARNRGVAEARAPLIVFLDDDVIPDPHVIALHLEAQSGTERCVSIGPLLPPPDDRLTVWCAWEERVLCRQYDAMVAGCWRPTYRQFYTGNAAVLKRHILDVGGFDASFRRAEDVELALRLHERGLEFVFLADARGWHYIRRTFDAWLRVPAAYGKADVAMARAGHPWTLVIVAQEYPRRNQGVRLITRACAGRPRAVRAVVTLLGSVVRAANARAWLPLGYAACSLIFNLLYYDGIAAALGGRPALQCLLRDGQDVARVTRLLALDRPASQNSG